MYAESFLAALCPQRQAFPCFTEFDLTCVSALPQFLQRQARVQLLPFFKHGQRDPISLVQAIFFRSFAFLPQVHLGEVEPGIPSSGD